MLGQALAMFDSLAQRILECDARIEALLVPLGRHNVELAGPLLRPIRCAPAMSRSESPWRMRTRTCRYSNTSNLLLLIGPPGKSSEGTQLRKFEMRFGMQPDITTSPLPGSITPILRWLLYADHRVAPLRRSCTGSITTIIWWLHYADPGMAPISRSVTRGTAGRHAASRGAKSLCVSARWIEPGVISRKPRFAGKFLNSAC